MANDSQDLSSSPKEPSPPAKEANKPPKSASIAEMLGKPLDIRSFALTILTVLAIFYTLYFAKTIFIPLTLAVLLSLLLWPPVRALQRIGIPEPLGAGVVLGTLTIVVALGFYWLSTPASKWIANVPQTLAKAERKLRGLQKPIERVKEVTEAVEKAAAVEDETGIKVEVKKPGIAAAVLEQTQGVLLDSFLTAAFLYFLLSSGDVFLRKLVKLAPRLREKKQTVEIVRQIQDDIATYIFTISIINACLGVAIGVAMYLLGLPNAALWGVMAALFNYIPYIGAIVGSLIVGLVALVNLDSSLAPIFAIVTYYGLSALEGTLITPMVLGQRLTLNPVVIFLALTVWGWMWGIPGALLAVPIVAAMKIVCDRVEQLRPVGEFLGK